MVLVSGGERLISPAMMDGKEVDRWTMTDVEDEGYWSRELANLKLPELK